MSLQPVADSYDDTAFSRPDVPATAAGASHLRQEFGRWLGENFAISDEHLYAIVLAAYEALANAAEHAYAGDPHPGTMSIEARHSPSSDRLSVTVSDRGRWRPPAHNRFRGRGIPLIRALCDRPVFVKEASGTTLTLEWVQVRAYSLSSAG
ncbi:ATP-binding protein [Williamsia muralis]|uniref:ATP-binding protein n=1 Tax=Williamsia marianensis TaxID=85044 RepID=UPI00382FE8BE